MKFREIKGSNILPGMAIKTEIRGLRASTEKKYIVPVKSLLQEGELYYLFLVDKADEKECMFRKTKVFLGDNDGCLLYTSRCV